MFAVGAVSSSDPSTLFPLIASFLRSKSRRQMRGREEVTGDSLSGPGNPGRASSEATQPRLASTSEGEKTESKSLLSEKLLLKRSSPTEC